MPFVVAVSGFKESGKTTLCLDLLDRFRQAGLEVGFVKHSAGCHGRPLIPADRDSGRGASAAIPSLLWTDEGIRLEEARSFDIEEILFRFFPAVDIVVVEGAKILPLPRVWVGPADPPGEVKGIFARYDHRTCGDLSRNLYGGGDEGLLAQRIIDLCRKAESTGVALYGGRRRIPAKSFVADFIAGGVLGMVSALKGAQWARDGLSLFIRSKKEEGSDA